MTHLPYSSSLYRSSLYRSLCIPGALALAACAGGSKGDPDNRGDFKLDTVSTGRGAVYPYRIREVDSFGNPTATVVNIENIETLKANVNGNNGVLPVGTFSTTAELPDGNPGNHFLEFTFSHKLDVESVLSPLLANQTNSGLTGALNVLAYDPATESTVTLQGRGFVNGYTYFNNGGVLAKVKAVEEDGQGVRVLDARANGFPSFAGAASLVGKKAFTFVADTDDDLTTLETFPSNRLIRLVVTNAVRDSEGDILEHEVCTATTVGDDPNPPQVLGYTAVPEIRPGANQTGIDPTTRILVRFNKPVQPAGVGSFFDPQQFVPPSGGITLSVTAAAQTYSILYHADPVDFGDLCNYIVTPAYQMPGLATVDVIVQNTVIRSLTQQLIGQSVATQFQTAAGPGLVNAPVAPEAVYVGISGTEPGLSVIDLNGFGQGTGDITNTRFPSNPNIGQPGVLPPLAPGTTNMDAGSGGAMTLVRASDLSTRLVREPVVGAVTDVHLGAPLDLVFNNENINVNASRANQTNPITNQVQSGNCISVAPHPNPPRLVFPPPNPSLSIFGEEPTVAGGQNMLQQGNPFSTQLGQLGVFGTVQIAFNGPAPPPLSPPPPPRYTPFAIRQQVGHFLYVIDADNRQIVVLNSNRMTVLDTIRTSDPVDLTVSPNLSRLAVANQASGTISFVDINPLSPTFHRVVAETRTERGPTSVAWQPDGEDVLAVCSAANALTIISALDFTVRRTVAGFLRSPIDVAVTPRFVSTGLSSGVYYAYVLNNDGSVGIYESGPDGINGIGFNDMIGSVPNATFTRARRIRLDYGFATGALLIGHTDEHGLGQVSRLELISGPQGPQPTSANSGGFILPPTFRQKTYGVTQRFGGLLPTTPVRDLLSGDSVADLCVDDLVNQGGALGQVTPYNAGINQPPFGHSGKEAVKGGAAALTPRFLFIALSDAGKVDVMELSTGRKVTTIDVPGVRVVGTYWRQ